MKKGLRQAVNGIFLIILSFGIESCYEPIDGCLDINAMNYDVTADHGCDECCTYPKIILNFLPQVDTFNFALDSVYLNDLQSPFEVLGYSFIISNISLKSKGAEQRVIEEIEVNCFGKDTMVVNDVWLVSNTTRRPTIGTFAPTLDYDQLQFTLGLDDCLNGIDTTVISTTTNLYKYIRSRYIDADNGYNVANITYVSPKNISDTITISMNGSAQSQNILLDGEYTAQIREELSLKIRLDIYKWMAGIDFEVDDTLVVKQKMMNNLQSVFFLEE